MIEAVVEDGELDGDVLDAEGLEGDTEIAVLEVVDTFPEVNVGLEVRVLLVTPGLEAELEIPVLKLDPVIGVVDDLLEVGIVLELWV